MKYISLIKFFVICALMGAESVYGAAAPKNYKKPIALTFLESKSVGLKEKLKSCKIIIIPIVITIRMQNMWTILNLFSSFIFINT